MKYFGDKEKTSIANADKLPQRSLLSRFDWLNRFRHWYMGGVSITRSIFRTRAALQGIMIILIIISILFIMAAYYTGSGEFVISLDSDMTEDGFYLSETNDFSERLVCIRGKAVTCADNINIADISYDVAQVDGEHNGMNYVAETFYLTNQTGETCDYEYALMIRSATKGAEEAMWIMLYHNGEQTIYAMEGAEGEPESQYSLLGFPFEEDAVDSTQYSKVSLEEANLQLEDYVDDVGRSSISDASKLTATPFASERIICQKQRKEIAHNEVDKYTVVIWYEGEDPECVDKILGGQVELYMKFNY